jgi:hypothetical protein
MPLFKRKSVYAATNYRGVHLTSQLSKAMERLLRLTFMPFMLDTVAFGPNQFAYVPERGARDVLAHLVLVWLKAFVRKRKVALYSSDVSGAFDRVQLDRLVAKLRAKRLHPDIIAVIASWLRSRTAHVVVGGEKSNQFTLENMVYQGTVWGPPLWNTFFEDARKAIHELFYTEIVFADDLNAYREFGKDVPNATLLKSLELCQAELHSWGEANQVTFDHTKESFHILSASEAHGGDFRTLGVTFDVFLNMKEAVNEVVVEAGWKLKMLLRTRRYYNTADVVILYKAHLLAYLEYRTAAVYHATRDILAKLDRVQAKFLEDGGIGEVDALMSFNLAPLETRRDMAILGIIHRTALGKGPPHFRDHFAMLPSGRMKDPRDELRGGVVQRSALGLVAVYNMLPGRCRGSRSVSDFQKSLQQIVKDRAAEGCLDWKNSLSPRVPLQRHPLLNA